ncbi:L,D-transpeptidase family protein [Bradyrhizobium sp. Tv2a-2]|uniref:L,D-transpeptidase family protein n=1 Tax=Bradyrhizobium sp. Tv2a-2 TaxID=113395 RepID=UPI00055FFE81|nr:L,D-transpeptidase family protein [Bradyrhizobium sp. Tv2a-2]
MRSGISNMTRRRMRIWPATLVIAVLAVLIGPVEQAVARGSGSAIQQVETRSAGEPILAIVSLQRQRITIYDAQGWILRAPVSSGQKGRETPSGIFAVIEKDADHHSNLYDDASMPHMQRLTWSGIALHGGPLPGYPASHGCVRMPYGFAEQLFDLTQMGLRVIIAPGDAAPVEIAHPALLRPKPGAGALVLARNADVAEATSKFNQARLAAGTAYREATAAMVPVRVAQNQKLRAETQLAAAETALTNATTDEAKQAADDAKAQVTARIADLQTQLDAAQAQLRLKADARTAARDAVGAAEAAQTAAAEAARQAAHELDPVSVLISRKTQKLYVRQGFEPIFDAPIAIADPDRPIGTYVFTALERTGGNDDIKWSVVSLEGARPQTDAVDSRGRPAARSGRDVEPILAVADGAKAALDRITIPQEVLERIPGTSPRSSMIVTDEAPSSETSKGTDFVVVLSDEPQGGIKFRKRAPAQDYRYIGTRYRAPASGAPASGAPTWGAPAWGAPAGGRFFTW